MTREAGLVQHVTSLKTQLQGLVTDYSGSPGPRMLSICRRRWAGGPTGAGGWDSGTVGQWDTAKLVAACQSDMVAGGGDLQGGYHEQLDQLEAQLLQHHQSSDCSQEQS